MYEKACKKRRRCAPPFFAICEKTVCVVKMTPLPTRAKANKYLFTFFYPYFVQHLGCVTLNCPIWGSLEAAPPWTVPFPGQDLRCPRYLGQSSALTSPPLLFSHVMEIPIRRELSQNLHCSFYAFCRRVFSHIPLPGLQCFHTFVRISLSVPWFGQNIAMKQRNWQNILGPSDAEFYVV